MATPKGVVTGLNHVKDISQGVMIPCKVILPWSCCSSERGNQVFWTKDSWLCWSPGSPVKMLMRSIWMLDLAGPDCQLIWRPLGFFFMHFALSLFACTSGKGFRCFLSSCFLPSTRPYCWFWEWHWWTVLPALLAGGLSVMTCHEGRGALKALKLLRSVKEKKQTIEENHREFSLSWRTSCLSEHNYFAGPFLPPLKTLSLIQVHSQWFISIWTCSSGQILGHGTKAMQRGISLEKLLRVSASLVHFGMWPCAGTHPLSSCLFHVCL